MAQCHGGIGRQVQNPGHALVKLGDQLQVEGQAAGADCTQPLGETRIIQQVIGAGNGIFARRTADDLAHPAH